MAALAVPLCLVTASVVVGSTAAPHHTRSTTHLCPAPGAQQGCWAGGEGGRGHGGRPLHLPNLRWDLGGSVKACREPDRTAETKPLLLSLSLTYHSQSVALALLLAKTVLSLWEREEPGSLTYFFSG